MLWEAVKLALQAIRRNAMRSFLTVLGIVIGVGAVIAMVTIGNGTTEKVRAELAKLGSNLLFMNPGQFGPGRSSSTAKSFNVRDVEAIRAQLAGVKAVAPLAQQSATIVFGAENRVSRVIGTTNDYFVTQDWPLSAGRQFLEGEIRAGSSACIVGETVRQKLFGSTSPLGEMLRVKQVACEVIGVLSAKGQSTFGSDQDDIVIVPLRAFQRRIAGNSDISSINISAQNGADTARVQADLERLMRERRNIVTGKEDDFSVRDTRQLAQTMTGTTEIMTQLLGAVASVSLLVGGIGIMNIMLANVLERTKEIGVRRAIGARRRDIRLQFLIEAITISALGGLLGIGLGFAIAQLVVYFAGWSTIITPWSVTLAFGVSTAVGILFGSYPAVQASRLSPIEALRYE